MQELLFGSEQENAEQIAREEKKKNPSPEGFVDPHEIKKDVMISDLLAVYPQAAAFLMECGMGCISCGAAQFETLEQAALVHGIDPDDLVEALNEQAENW